MSLSDLLRGVEIAPLLRRGIEGPPHVFDFTSRNPAIGEYDPAHFEAFQARVSGEILASGKCWGMGRYLEERAQLLRHYPQMIREGRVIHAGVDVVVPAGTALCAPLEGTVHLTGFEDGLGNYGGYVVLRHERERTTVFTLYGHLDRRHGVRCGQVVRAGDQIGMVGGGEDSGGWFTHVHLQVITEEAARQERMFQGYVTLGDVPDLDRLFPSPYPLLPSLGEAE